MDQEEEIIDRIAEKILNKLRDANVLKDGKTAFQKTESLLYNYNFYKNIIKEKENYIEELKQTGVHKKSKSITGMYQGGEKLSDAEILEQQIKEIKFSIGLTKKCLSKIDKALDSIKEDKYYKIIELKYLRNMTLEDISFELDKDVSTISRNKNRLINEMKIFLFTEDSIREIMQ